MAYSELVSFIKGEMKNGKDAVTIRNYLLQRGVDSEAINSAFDEVFGQGQREQEKVRAHKEHSAEKVVMAGVVIFVIVLVVIGFKFYNDIGTSVTPTTGSGHSSTSSGVVGTDTPKAPTAQDFSTSSTCNYDNDTVMYNCFVYKFKNQDFSCSQISDPDEKTYCYRAQDLYVMTA